MTNSERIALYNQCKEKMETISRMVGDYQRLYKDRVKSMDCITAEIQEIDNLKTTVLPPLYRIMRERSNAARNLRPKKSRCGFCVRRITEETRRLNKTWRAIIQTPYPQWLAPADVHTLWSLIGERQCQEGLGLAEDDIIANRQSARLDLQPVTTTEDNAYWCFILTLRFFPKDLF